MQGIVIFPKEWTKTRSRVDSDPNGAPNLGGGDPHVSLNHEARQNAEHSKWKH